MTQPARVALQRAEHLRLAKRPREALDALGPALAEPATAHDAYCSQALLLSDLGRVTEALAAARHAEASDPLDERGFRIEGLIRVNHMKGEGAEAPAREAVRLASNLWTRYVLVYALKKRRQRREAREIATALLADEPHSALAYDALGLVELRVRNWAAAEALYRKAVELEPHNALFATRLGNALQAQKKTAEAGSAYLAAARSDPTNAAHRRRLAQVGLTASAGGFLTLIKFGLLANLVRVLAGSSDTGQPAGSSRNTALIVWVVLLIAGGLTIAFRYGALRRGASVLPESLQSAMRLEHRRSIGRWLGYGSAVLAVFALFVFRSNTGAGVACATATAAIAAAAWLLTRGSSKAPRRRLTLRMVGFAVAFLAIAAAVLLPGDHKPNVTQSPDAIASLLPTDDQLLTAADCMSSTLATRPSPLPLASVAFVCNSANGHLVEWAYFGSPRDARTWAREQATAKHLPRNDARVGLAWAVVTADHSVLSQFGALGGVAPN